MPSLLVVEDHVALADSLVYFLRRNGDLEVAAVAHSGAAALAKLPHVAVQLALIDVSLPDMSGIELVDAIRQQEPTMICLMLSGHNERSYADRALAAGARGYVLKGNPPALLEAIRFVLEGDLYVSSDLR